jgi:hypothetical protein
MLKRQKLAFKDLKKESLDIIHQFHQAYVHHETDEEAFHRYFPPQTDKDMAKKSVEIAFRNYSDYEDLSLLIVENRTNVNFISSDDPVVAKNYYYPQNGYGLGVRGVLYLFPITR